MTNITIAIIIYNHYVIIAIISAIAQKIQSMDPRFQWFGFFGKIFQATTVETYDAQGRLRIQRHPRLSHCLRAKTFTTISKAHEAQAEITLFREAVTKTLLI